MAEPNLSGVLEHLFKRSSEARHLEFHVFIALTFTGVEEGGDVHTLRDSARMSTKLGKVDVV
jgi:hypothetical protein